MAKNLKLLQTSTAATCGTGSAYCSGVTTVTTPQGFLCQGTGSAGGAKTVTVTASAANLYGLVLDCAIPAGYSWDAGTWTIPVNVTTANSNLTIASCFVCRVNSGCTNQSTIGSATSLGISCGSTGVKNITVTGAAQSPAATDRVVIVVTFTNSKSSSQTVGITGNQTINTPFGAVANQYDWPNPIPPVMSGRQLAYMTSVDVNGGDNTNVLHAQDRVYGGPGEVPDYDWTNPVGVSTAAQASARFVSQISQPAGTTPLLTTLVGKDVLPENQKDWPNPTLLRGAWIVSLRSQFDVTGSYNTIPQVVLTPRSPYQFKFEPPSSVAAVNAQPQGVGGPLLEPPPPVPPPMNYDWPNPVREISRGVALSAQWDVIGHPLALVQNIIIGAQYKAGVTPYPSMVALTAQPLGTFPGYIPPPSQAPFSQTDWPNARAAKGLLQDFVPFNFVAFFQSGQPFNKYDWPNPRAAKVPVADYAFRNTAALYGKDVLPFRNLDQPNPRGPVQPQQIFLPRNLALLAQAGSPFNQQSWPNPQGPRPVVPWTDERNIALLSAAAGAKPASNYDWPNPRAAAQGPVHATTTGSNPNLIPTPTPSTTAPWAGFIGMNAGRMMTRRG